MSALVALPRRDRLQAVMVERYGTGWCVGIGPLVAGGLERDVSCHIGEKEAVRAAVALSDANDLLAFRVDTG